MANPARCSPTWLKLSFEEYSGGAPLVVRYAVLTGRDPLPRVLLIAGVHGDEYEGVAALHDVVRDLDPEELKGTLTVVPVANPTAFHAGARKSPVDRVDLNRSFPGNPEGTISERLAHRLFHEIVLGNEIFLSLHGWSKEAMVVPYAEYPHGTSEAAERSREAAHALGLEYLHPYDWPRGVLGEAALQHGIAAVETEVGGMGTITPEGQQISRNLIWRFLRHLGMLDPNGGMGVGPDRSAKVVEHEDCFANRAGLFRSRVRCGEMVVAEATLGTVHGLAGEIIEEIRSPRKGMVAILRTMASVQPGDRLVQLFFWNSSEEDSARAGSGGLI